MQDFVDGAVSSSQQKQNQQDKNTDTPAMAQMEQWAQADNEHLFRQHPALVDHQLTANEVDVIDY